jgi:DNA-binding Lrp family transcriptional regulator
MNKNRGKCPWRMIMVIGITMVKVLPEQEKAAYHALREMDGIKEVYHLFGEFDFFVIMNAESKSRLNHLLEAIRDRREVIETWPLLISKDESIPEVEIAFSQMEVLAIS